MSRLKNEVIVGDITALYIMYNIVIRLGKFIHKIVVTV